MRSDSGHTMSVWMDNTDMPQLPRVTQDMRANVCIIGAGIAGMTTAYQLARAGRAVIVIDDGQIGGGETGRTTARTPCDAGSPLALTEPRSQRPQRCTAATSSGEPTPPRAANSANVFTSAQRCSRASFAARTGSARRSR